MKVPSGVGRGDVKEKKVGRKKSCKIEKDRKGKKDP